MTPAILIMSPTVLMICAGIVLIGLILGAIIFYAGIQIGRELEQLHIITQVHRHKAKAEQEAAQREEQVL